MAQTPTRSVSAPSSPSRSSASAAPARTSRPAPTSTSVSRSRVQSGPTTSGRSTTTTASNTPSSSSSRSSSNSADRNQVHLDGDYNGVAGANLRWLAEHQNEVSEPSQTTEVGAAAAADPAGDDDRSGSLPNYGRNLSFVDFQTQRGDQASQLGSKWLSDIVSHVPTNLGNTYYDRDPITWAHESTHGINASVRNMYSRDGQRVNAFYVGDNKAVVIPEPNISKSSVSQFIPDNLRTSRSQLYVDGMREWNDRPLYLLDEFTAYTNGGAAGVELAKQGRWTQGGRDGVQGQLEFTAYAFALGQAVEKQDPNYFKNNPQFKEYLAYAGLRAMDGYREGSKIPAFANSSQERFYDNFKNSEQAKPLRDFIERNYGKEYVDRLFNGGADPKPTPGPAPSPTPPGPSPTPGPSPSPTPGPSPSPSPGPSPSPPGPAPSPTPPPPSPSPCPGPGPCPDGGGGDGGDGGGDAGDEGGGFLEGLLQLIASILQAAGVEGGANGAAGAEGAAPQSADQVLSEGLRSAEETLGGANGPEGFGSGLTPACLKLASDYVTFKQNNTPIDPEIERRVLGVLSSLEQSGM